MCFKGHAPRFSQAQKWVWLSCLIFHYIYENRWNLLSCSHQKPPPPTFEIIHSHCRNTASSQHAEYRLLGPTDLSVEFFQVIPDLTFIHHWSFSFSLNPFTKHKAQGDLAGEDWGEESRSCHFNLCPLPLNYPSLSPVVHIFLIHSFLPIKWQKILISLASFNCI